MKTVYAPLKVPFSGTVTFVALLRKFECVVTAFYLGEYSWLDWEHISKVAGLDAKDEDLVR